MIYKKILFGYQAFPFLLYIRTSQLIQIKLFMISFDTKSEKSTKKLNFIY